ncbi:hypothetical protein CPC735_038090 [Coccidioides posadasii C735 delta SOWgp]|uniref:Cytochrome c domain-containing protein n=2 Tax=Coccidioides posadasii TaxID=199306 RepID=A0A0J6F1F8_COCPO|nr:hypothetical protein CPC735_038090 [Coccidioides posadasii C735 delta SOWgp]EER29103.1 hypothetical protein CPC735_038090 [Coccidioides posadasii C735 delta SOWgp]KMM63923.1 hypothetical protein CPAG_00276 [Coccidioides posadasii RMSCC 3488]|eukprot:XP_003071248.1 hypothetical protein CPC735_038090 [Coccidioides posadasii C735 delta SOWgp]
MKFFGFTLLFLQAFLVCAQATTQPKLENFTLASGSVTNTLDPNEKYEKESRDINEVIKLDPTNITMAIPPEDLPSGNPTERQHARDLSKRPGKCPVHLPWLCDGVVVFFDSMGHQFQLRCGECHASNAIDRAVRLLYDRSLC